MSRRSGGSRQGGPAGDGAYANARTLPLRSACEVASCRSWSFFLRLGTSPSCGKKFTPARLVCWIAHGQHCVFLCMICSSGLDISLTRAHYQYAEHLEQASISADSRSFCLFCLNRGVCVLDSEWHFALHCPHFRDLRSSGLRNIEIGSEFLESPRPSATLLDLLALCAKEPT